MKNLLFIISLGAGFSACSFGVYKNISSQTTAVQKQDSTFNSVDSIVSPYKMVLDKEMNEVIAKAHVNFTKNRPNGNLNNLISDILLSSKKELGITQETVICIQNFGGLRAPINKGDVTLGDVFKVLPFDNFVVAVKLPASTIPKIVKWLKESNGHPIAGCKLVGDTLIANNQKVIDTDFWVITSDYLLNGGDLATFFSDRIELKETNTLLRDVVISYLKANPDLLDDSRERIKMN